MRADEKVRELPAAGAGLGEQLRYRHLQQALGEQERRLERDACDGAAKGGRGQLEIRALVEEPRRGTLKYRDRKSTRLNSSHLVISYAVFCLKKKKSQDTTASVY